MGQKTQIREEMDRFDRYANILSQTDSLEEYALVFDSYGMQDLGEDSLFMKIRKNIERLLSSQKNKDK